jgi:hypothetical protein
MFRRSATRPEGAQSPAQNAHNLKHNDVERQCPDDGLFSNWSLDRRGNASEKWDMPGHRGVAPVHI